MKGSSGKPSNQLEFSIFKVASAIGWDSGIVKKELKNLEWSNSKFFISIMQWPPNFIEIVLSNEHILHKVPSIHNYYLL